MGSNHKLSSLFQIYCVTAESILGTGPTCLRAVATVTVPTIIPIRTRSPTTAVSVIRRGGRARGTAAVIVVALVVAQRWTARTVVSGWTARAGPRASPIAGGTTLPSVSVVDPIVSGTIVSISATVVTAASIVHVGRRGHAPVGRTPTVIVAITVVASPTIPIAAIHTAAAPTVHVAFASHVLDRQHGLIQLASVGRFLGLGRFGNSFELHKGVIAFQINAHEFPERLE